jgi:acetolactate synthase-1/2/3 large subunit
MNAAEALIRTAVGAGVDLCLANPGTTEMPLVVALDRVPGMRAVLCLFEGVCSAAADGYARMTGRPALTLLHLGPGFANAIANLHNARRARSPLVNLIGDHAVRHRPFDAPLASDIGALARPVSGWLRSSEASEQLARDGADAVAAARRGQVATLVVPHDVGLGDCAGPARPVRPGPPAAVEGADVESAAALLRKSASSVLFLGGSALSARGLRAAARLAAARGCRLFCDTFPARLERGAGLPAVLRLPYFPDQARAALGDAHAVVFAGARPPVSFFGYPDTPSEIIPNDVRTHSLAPPGGDGAVALEALADALAAPAGPGAVCAPSRPGRPTGALTPETVAAALAGLQPEGAIVMDEGLTAGLPYFAAAAGAALHTYLGLTGGAIGQGLPCATGAALACPDRRVIALQADGSGMYTLQALWTQAREGLDVTNLILANRGYRILEVELARAGSAPGARARTLMDFSQPAPDWVGLARGFGVPGERVSDADTLVKALSRSLSTPGPHLIEVQLPAPGDGP